MKQHFLKYYKDYGEYVNSMRMIPNFIDGLRPVERRVLYALYLEAKDKFKKSAYIVGKANILHPHGEQSIYQSLVKLVRNNFADGQGNWGVKVGIDDYDAAAMRYTECRLNNKIKEILFEFIDYVDYDIIEIEKEPLYLPAYVPAGLLFDELNSGIGFGIKTTIPSYQLQDLVKRLLWLKGKIRKEPIIQPTFKNNIILSGKEECKNLLTKGEGSLKFIPKMDINKQNRNITIFGRPVNKNFTSLLNVFDKEIQQGIIYVIDNSTVSTKLEVGINKNKKYNFDDFVDKVKQKLTSTINFKMYFTDSSGKPVIKSVDELLITCYNNIYKLFNLKLKKDIENKQKLIKEYEIILKIRPHIKKNISNNNKDFDYDKFTDDVSEKINVQQKDIKDILSKYNIKTLLTIDRDIDKLNNDIKELQKMENNEDVIVEMYQKFNK